MNDIERGLAQMYRGLYKIGYSCRKIAKEIGKYYSSIVKNRDILKYRIL